MDNKQINLLNERVKTILLLFHLSMYVALFIGLLISSIYFSQIGYDPVSSGDSFLVLFAKVCAYGFFLSLIICGGPALPSLFIENSLDALKKRLYENGGADNKTKLSLLKGEAKLIGLLILFPSFVFCLSFYYLANLADYFLLKQFVYTPYSITIVFAAMLISCACIFVVSKLQKCKIFCDEYFIISAFIFLIGIISLSWLEFVRLLRYDLTDEISIYVIYVMYLVSVSAIFNRGSARWICVGVFAIWLSIFVLHDRYPALIFKFLKLRIENVSFLIKPDACGKFELFSGINLQKTDLGCLAKGDILYKGSSESYLSIKDINSVGSGAGLNKLVNVYQKEFNNSEFDYYKQHE